MTAELRDFAQSILRMDSERIMWFEQSQRLAKKCDAQAVELERVTARLAESESDRADVRERVREACACLREAIGSNGSKNVEEYAERAAARITELEARLAAVAPAVEAPVETAEVDGFRVGDLVRNLASAPSLAWGTVRHLSRFVEVEYAGAPHRIAYCSDELTRKPVEVGDTVRCTAVGYESKRGKVVELGALGKSCAVTTAPGSTLYMPAAHLVAVAP